MQKDDSIEIVGKCPIVMLFEGLKAGMARLRTKAIEPKIVKP